MIASINIKSCKAYEIKKIQIFEWKNPLWRYLKTIGEKLRNTVSGCLNEYFLKILNQLKT